MIRSIFYGYILSGTKGKFSKILIALDGSEHSFKAAEYAIEIGKKYYSGVQLIAFTVLDISKPRHITSAFITAPTYGLRELEEERKEAQQWLDRVANMVSEKGNNTNNIQFKSQIEESISVEGEIVNYAEQENVDLIVIGTRGRSGFTKLLLGSVASRVVTYAPCPVLVVKQLFKKKYPLLLAGIRYYLSQNNYKNISVIKYNEAEYRSLGNILSRMGIRYDKTYKYNYHRLASLLLLTFRNNPFRTGTLSISTQQERIFRLAKSLGMNAFRISLEQARIHPKKTKLR